MLIVNIGQIIHKLCLVTVIIPFKTTTRTVFVEQKAGLVALLHVTHAGVLGVG